MFGLAGEWRAKCDVTGDEKRRRLLLIQQIMGREGTHGHRTHPILLTLETTPVATFQLFDEEC